MKLLLENWRQYLNENVFYVDIERLLPTQEQGHGEVGKGHDCPSAECEAHLQSKMDLIASGKIPPLEVSNKKPIRPYRIQSLPTGKAPKSDVEEPFYFVLDGHHRLEAAKRMGVDKLPVFLTPEEAEK
ncbi:MAG: ParB N-terminal domain-containing protein [Flavobacteriales bacterium]|jgi:hypothetical protein|nr:ParB N-terminal domain-containing protein [Flavobacteriales bacterium]